MFETSESVTIGHPDKCADQVSDMILDVALRKVHEHDPALVPYVRVAIETAIKKHLVLLGEVTMPQNLPLLKKDLNVRIRNLLADIGYVGNGSGFDPNSAHITLDWSAQSADIALGVDRGALESQGAGDQGMMYGAAWNETPDYMPLTHALARKLTEVLAVVRRDGSLPYLRPDGKSQVTVEYDRQTGQPLRVDAVVLSAQHERGVSQEKIRDDIRRRVIDTVCGRWMDERTAVHINPTGAFVVGGPAGDAGVTGRKIIVDTYGGRARHGGGAFSGKDPSKVDRTGAYMGRYIAKNIVAAGLANQCEVQVSYAIGEAEPTSIRVNTAGQRSPEDEARIEEAVRQIFDLRPGAMVRNLRLLEPPFNFRSLAAYGHFGENAERLGKAWEQTDHIDDLLAAVGPLSDR